MKELKYSKILDIRFSEVDSMGVVWHGSYPLYFEDAREGWGKQYGLGYLDYLGNDVYAPLVEMNIQYKRPIFYGTKPRVDIIYRFTEAAKVVFDYEIRDNETNELLTSAHSVQVFMDKQYQLIWQNPSFYEAWKKKWEQA